MHPLLARYVETAKIEKAYRVSRSNFRRLQSAAASRPQLQAMLEQGRIEPADARGRKLTEAQRARRDLRDGISKPPRGATLYEMRPKVGPDAPAVEARLADRNGVVRTSWGSELKHRKGKDYITTYGPGDQGVVRGDIFRTTYLPKGEGRYVKNPDARLRAFLNDRPRTIRTLEGPVKADAGDVVMVGTVGEMWPIRRDKDGRSKVAGKYDVQAPRRDTTRGKR